MKVMEIKFSANLKALRENAGLTQSQLADKLHTTQRKVSHWERGNVEPDLASLWSIADLFDIPVDELIGRADPM